MERELEKTGRAITLWCRSDPQVKERGKEDLMDGLFVSQGRFAKDNGESLSQSLPSEESCVSQE